MKLTQDMFCIHNSHLHGRKLDWQMQFDSRSLSRCDLAAWIQHVCCTHGC